MNRDHQRANSAFENVQTMLTGEGKKEYGRLALRLPFLIRSSGLVQALTFVDEKAGDVPLLRHLAHTVGVAQGGLAMSKTDLLRQARETNDPAAYLMLTRETLRAATWYKRLATSILGAEEGDDG